MSVEVSHEDVQQKGSALFLNKDILEEAAKGDNNNGFAFSLKIRKK